MKKNSTRRDRYNYKAIEKSQNLKSRQEEIDDVKTYFGQLNEEEKQWMNKFMSEYNNADFRHDDPLHDTEELKKACEDKNNARNRCIYTREQSQGRLKHFEMNTELEKLPVDDFSKPVRKKRSKNKKKPNLQ